MLILTDVTCVIVSDRMQTLKVDGQDKPTVASDARPVNRGRASINPELSAAACESLRILVLTVDKTIAPPKSKPALHVRFLPCHSPHAQRMEGSCTL